jgi:hypothetical protein
MPRVIRSRDGEITFPSTETITFSNKPSFDAGVDMEGELILKEQATPANPSATYHKLYPKSDGKFYQKDSSGTEKVLGTGVPVGSIMPWIGGYFTAGGNGGTYTNAIGNTIAAVNTLLNDDGWHVCNGTAPNDAQSPIFNTSGKYLPDLTDNIFLQGIGTSVTGAGGTGGSNVLTDHTHSFSLTAAGQSHSGNSSSVSSSGAHAHFIYACTSGGGSNRRPDAIETCANTAQAGSVSAEPDHIHTVSISHTHSSSSVSGSVGTGSAASSTENRPQYLNVFYIIKIK